MSLRFIRGASTPGKEYVCISCRLRNRPSSNQQALRYQSTSVQQLDSTPPPLVNPSLSSSEKSSESVTEQAKENGLRKGTSAEKPVGSNLAETDALQKRLLQKFVEKRRQYALKLRPPAESKVMPKLETVVKGPILEPKKLTKNAVVAEGVLNLDEAGADVKSSKNPRKRGNKDIKTAPSTPSAKSKTKGSRNENTGLEDTTRSELAEKMQSHVTDLKKVLESNDKIERKSKREILSTVEARLKRKALRVSKVRKISLETPSKVKVGKTEAEAGRYPKPARNSSLTNNKSLQAALRSDGQRKSKGIQKTEIQKVNAEELELSPLAINQPPVPSLAYGLERVLFNPGVYHLQDPRSRVFNFDPYLQKIMPVAEFDFDALKEYKTSSRDQSLKRLAQSHGKRYAGSTSSMTGTLAHFHFLLSQWREINTSMLSKNFPDDLRGYTEFQRCPNAIFLRWQDGSYAIDADKQLDTANILMMLGKSMEKLLTLNTGEFERYRKSNPDQVSSEERNAPESFHYTTMGDFLMRSQLDAFDPRLPGTGMFDLKTRAVVSVRMEHRNHKRGVGYQIKDGQGEWESFEREYYDMIRAAFLKYSLQVRMGRMDGIFVAYHNTQRIFGFQYISLPEMDLTLHGQYDTSIGDQEFKVSIDLLNKVLDKATRKYPETSLRIHFETRELAAPFMYIFAEPVTEAQVDEIQSQKNAENERITRELLGLGEEKSEEEQAQEEDDKWADIQADVQDAMTQDEMSLHGPSVAETLPDIASEEPASDIDHPEVHEEGPLYAKRSLGETPEGAFGFAADAEEDEIDNVAEEDEEVEAEENHKLRTEADAVDNEGQVGEISEDGEIAGDNYVEEIEERPKIKDEDAGAEVDPGTGTKADELKPNEDHSKTQVNEGNESSNTETSASTSDQPSPPFAKDGATAASEEFETQADAPFLDEMINDPGPPPGAQVLAMALTIRNKVDDQYVLRPENLKPGNKWSVEYALNEVPNAESAWSLYLACQKRREAKSSVPMAASPYIENLRKLSKQGAKWRKEMDKRDGKKQVAVVGRPVKEREERGETPMEAREE